LLCAAEVDYGTATMAPELRCPSCGQRTHSMRAIAPGIEMVCAECAAALQANDVREVARTHRRDDLLTRLPALIRKVREMVGLEWERGRKRANRGR